MKKIFVLCLLLVGCDYKDLPRNEWEIAANTHTCSDVQMQKAQAESKWCSDNTTYFSSYCYGTAIIRNCTRRVQP